MRMDVAGEASSANNKTNNSQQAQRQRQRPSISGSSSPAKGLNGETSAGSAAATSSPANISASSSHPTPPAGHYSSRSDFSAESQQLDAIAKEVRVGMKTFSPLTFSLRIAFFQRVEMSSSRPQSRSGRALAQPQTCLAPWPAETSYWQPDTSCLPRRPPSPCRPGSKQISLVTFAFNFAISSTEGVHFAPYRASAMEFPLSSLERKQIFHAGKRPCEKNSFMKGKRVQVNFQSVKLDSLPKSHAPHFRSMACV